MGKTQFAITDALTAADIKIIRNQLKMTQKEFAALVNVTHKPLSGGKVVKKRLRVPLCHW